MDNIKESFHRVKGDVDSLRYEIDLLKSNLNETRKKVIEICEVITKIDG